MVVTQSLDTVSVCVGCRCVCVLVSQWEGMCVLLWRLCVWLCCYGECGCGCVVMETVGVAVQSKTKTQDQELPQDELAPPYPLDCLMLVPCSGGFTRHTAPCYCTVVTQCRHHRDHLQRQHICESTLFCSRTLLKTSLGKRALANLSYCM